MCSYTRMETTERITTSKVNVYMPVRLRDEMNALAHKHDRPTSREIRRALEQYVERQRAEADAA